MRKAAASVPRNAIEWVASLVAGVVAVVALGIGLLAVLALRAPQLKMNASPVKVLAGALVAGVLALAVRSWADRHRRAREALLQAADTRVASSPAAPPTRGKPTREVPTTAEAALGERTSSLDAIKGQLLQLLKQPHVLQSTMAFQRSDLVMALEQQGFRGDHPDLENLVERAVSALLAEGRLQEQGTWVRARL